MRVGSSINSMPCSMHEYDVAAVAISQNERIPRTHQSSAVYTSAHLAPPLSARDASSIARAPSAHLVPPIPACNAPLSMAQAGFFSTQDTRLPFLALGRYNGRTGNKRTCEDLLQDACEFKRQQCLMPPGFGAMQGPVSAIGFDDRSAQNAGLTLQEHSRNFVHAHLQQARMPLDGEKMLKVGLHNHPQSMIRSDGANKDPLVIQEVISSTVNREKKTLASQDEDHVSTFSLPQQGKQSSPCQAQVGEPLSPSFSKLHSRVLMDVTNKFQITTTPDAKKHMEEEDIHRLSQRYKQIEFGKNTLGYERYLDLVPKSKRKGKDPRTPNPKQVCSKRSWDGQIRKWRRLLHDYDPPAEDGEELAEDMTLLKAKQKNNKPELGKDDIDPKALQARPQEVTLDGATGGVATQDGLSIYDDWMDC